jgi:tetratricopeptide (TPR) repeat protein
MTALRHMKQRFRMPPASSAADAGDRHRRRRIRDLPSHIKTLEAILIVGKIRNVFQIAMLRLTAAVTAAGDSPTQLAASFETGKQALQRGDLTTAEKAFQEVLAGSPGNASAHANLGVVYMRRHQWVRALDELQRANALEPATPGIRLNIGLAYFRQADYANAIPALQSVAKEQPALEQARYLLGLCYFLFDRYQECIGALESLWASSSGDLNYLYVLMVAAGKVGREDLADKASDRLWHVGADSAELRLFWGMALLARDQDSKALEQFREAGRREPQLRFLHYYLGLTYKRQHKWEEAKREFLKDRGLEPDVAYNYDELGAISVALQEFQPAKKYFQESLKRDSSLATRELQRHVQDNLQRAVSGAKYRDLQVAREK